MDNRRLCGDDVSCTRLHLRANQSGEEAAATAAAAATAINEGLPTVQAALTEAGPTLNAALTNAPTYEAEMTNMVATANAAGQDIGPTLTAAAAQGIGVSPNGGQWAISASASSQYGEDSWSAAQATGAPNTPQCGDQPSAWASATSTELATLTLTYAVPVVPSQIDIYETNAPDFITMVEVVEPNGTRHTVFTGQPNPVDQGPCPYIVTINISDVTAPVNQVVITVDQTNAPSWNEIDAVELIGQ